MSDVKPHWDVFISYNGEDARFVAKLKKQMEHYTPPRGLIAVRKKLKPFSWESDMVGRGPEYEESIKAYLKDSKKLVLICSPWARKSKYVSDEVKWFAELQGKENIIPVLLRGIPNNTKGPEKLNAFPDVLCELFEIPVAVRYSDFQTWHQIKKGEFESAWYHLIARVYDKKRGEVEQRERRRRRLIRLWSTVLLLGIGTILIWGWFQDRQAKEQLARNQWSSGVYYRENDEPVRAAHWFAKAVGSPDKNLGNAARLAATHAIRGARLETIIRPVRTGKENSGALSGGVLSQDGNALFSWGDDGLFVSCLNDAEGCGDDKTGAGTMWVWVNPSGESSVLGRTDLLDLINNLPVRTGKLENIEGPGDLSLDWGKDNTVFLADSSGKEKRLLPLHHWDDVRGGVYESKNSRFVTWGDDPYLRSWLITPKRSELIDEEVEKRKELREEFAKPCAEKSSLMKSLEKLGRKVNSVSCFGHEHDDLLLSWENWEADDGTKENTVTLWETLAQDTFGHPGPALHHSGEVVGAVLSKDRTRILSWSRDESVRLWNRYTGKMLLAPMIHKAPVKGARFNSNESLILSWGGTPGQVRLWDVAMGVEVIPSLAHRDPVENARFNADETVIETWDLDNKYWSWYLGYDCSVSGEEISLLIQAESGTRLNGSAELEKLRTPSEHHAIVEQLQNSEVHSVGDWLGTKKVQCAADSFAETKLQELRRWFSQFKNS